MNELINIINTDNEPNIINRIMDERYFKSTNNLPPIPTRVQIVEFEESLETIKVVYLDQEDNTIPTIISVDHFIDWLTDRELIGKITELHYSDIEREIIYYIEYHDLGRSDKIAYAEEYLLG